MGVMQKLGQEKIIESAKQLNNYMQSVDDSLKELLTAFNHNTQSFAKELTEIQQKLDSIEKQIQEVKNGSKETEASK